MVEVVESVDNACNSSVTRLRLIGVLAGEYLRRVLQRKGVKAYDEKSKRFDIPFATGNCAGKSRIFLVENFECEQH